MTTLDTTPGVTGQPAPPAATQDPAALTAARAHVRAVVKRSGTSFALGMRILPAPRRQAMHAIYAFSREIDDIADEPGAPADKLAGLDAWRQEIDRLYDGAPSRPTALALLEPVAQFDLPKAEFLALIEGMEMDARAPMHGPSMAELMRYCRHVAGAVGLLSLPVFGASGAHAERFAITLGEALQITNILRDVAEDAADGRLYLPADLLKTYGIDTRVPAEVTAHPALPRVRGALAAVARDRFAKADAALARCDRRRLRPALAMMGVYERLLDRLEAQGWDRLAPPKIGKVAKLRAALFQGLWRPARPAAD